MDSLRNFMIGGIAVIGGYLMNRGSYSAETFESPYAGAGALMDITKDTSLGDFSKQELTESSAIHGDFDHASLNYSGHQNIQARAETLTEYPVCGSCGSSHHKDEYGSYDTEVGDYMKSKITPLLHPMRKQDKICDSCVGDLVFGENDFEIVECEAVGCGNEAFAGWGVCSECIDNKPLRQGAEAESKDYEKAYNRLKDALYDDWVYRDIEDSCNCEYIVDQKLESGEITMEEAESDTPQCQYCVVMDVFNEYGAETFNSYKVAPELSSYTKDELISSKAGPQGTATYDEMEYDPIAQDRLSAEELFPPYTYDYSDEVKARVLNKILLWHENMQLQSEGIADRMDRILWMLDNPDKYWEDWDLHAKDMGYEGYDAEEFGVHEEER